MFICFPIPYHSWERPFLLVNTFPLSLSLPSLPTVTQRRGCARKHQCAQRTLGCEAAEGSAPKWDVRGDQLFWKGRLAKRAGRGREGGTLIPRVYLYGQEPLPWAAHQLEWGRQGWGWWAQVLGLGVLIPLRSGVWPQSSSDLQDWSSKGQESISFIQTLVFQSQWYRICNIFEFTKSCDTTVSRGSMALQN